MPLLVLLAGLALPFMELVVLIKVGQSIGVWRLLLLLIGMAALGAALLYWQGGTTLRQAHAALMRGEPPVGPMLDGVLLVAAGVLLLAPGLITDAVALVLLVPPLRRAIGRGLLRRAIGAGGVHVETYRTGDRAAEPRGRGQVIEGEYERIDEPPPNGKPRSETERRLR